MTMTMSTTGPLLAALALATVVAGVACGPPGTTVADASSDNPCLLVKPAEIHAVFGAAVGGPVTDNVPPALIGERLCQFQTADPSRPTAVLRMGVVNSFAGSLFDRYADTHEVRPVRSLGATAVWNGAANTLVAKKGDELLTVLVTGPGVKDHRAKATRFAQWALRRL